MTYKLQTSQRNTEFISVLTTLLIRFFQIKPLYLFYFFLLKCKMIDLYRVIVNINKSDFFIPEYFSMKFSEIGRAHV